jgi:hypothetical protein
VAILALMERDKKCVQIFDPKIRREEMTKEILAGGRIILRLILKE